MSNIWKKNMFCDAVCAVTKWILGKLRLCNMNAKMQMFFPQNNLEKTNIPCYLFLLTS